MDNMGSTLLYIVVMVAVPIFAYVTTKYFSKKTRRAMKSRHISVLDNMALAKDKALYLTEVGGKCYLIGVTNQSINTLGEIDREALEETDQNAPSADEGGLFSKASSFFSHVKNAQSELTKARAQYKEQKKEGARPGSRPTDEDVLERMNRAIEQRKRRGGGDGDRV